MNEKLECLRGILRAHQPLMIAYSGGVDSAYLLAVAHETLGARMLAVIADSPSLPRQALSDALDLAARLGAPVEVVHTQEMDDPRYASNPVNRCYFCKSELFLQMEKLAKERGFPAIAYGENADDAQHFRPGSKAAEEFSVLAPLKEAGLTKAEIRALSHALDLPTADAPSQPCLSSRIPHGTPVTPAALAMIERGEALVRQLGFRVFRVRHLESDAGARARLQVAPEEMDRLPALIPALDQGLRDAGYLALEIDPDGYRSPA